MKDKTEQDEKAGEPTITTMDFEEFQFVADAFIERSSQGFDEMPASVFFALLMEKMADRRLAETHESGQNLH